jgi:hypothetical protein
VPETVAPIAAPPDVPAPLPGYRVWRRLLAFALTLVAVDVAVRAWAPATDFDDDYRLPDEAEVVLLPALLDHIRTVRQGGTPVVAVVGSSPTWGIRIRNRHATVPAVLERALRQRFKRPVEVYNLSAKGFLIGDQAFIARAIARDVDGLVLQVNYHTFAPAIADDVRIRHPELPAMLDQAVGVAEGTRLHMAPTPPGNWNAPIRKALRRHWAFFRERDRLMVGWLGTTPATWVHRWLSPGTTRAMEEDAGAPFDDLAPARQLMIMKRYGRSVAFGIAEANTERATLLALGESLGAQGTPLLTYLAPINRDALDDFEAMDWDCYRRNAAFIRQAATLAGGRFFDSNAGPAMVPGADFYDISHTLDAGGERFGRRLADEVADWLGPEGLPSGKAGRR